MKQHYYNEYSVLDIFARVIGPRLEENGNEITISIMVFLFEGIILCFQLLALLSGMFSNAFVWGHSKFWISYYTTNEFSLSHIVDIGRYQLSISTFRIFLLARLLPVRPHPALRGMHACMQWSRFIYLAEDSKHSMNFWYIAKQKANFIHVFVFSSSSYFIT